MSFSTNLVDYLRRKATFIIKGILHESSENNIMKRMTSKYKENWWFYWCLGGRMTNLKKATGDYIYSEKQKAEMMEMRKHRHLSSLWMIRERLGQNDRLVFLFNREILVNTVLNNIFEDETSLNIMPCSSVKICRSDLSISLGRPED